MLKIILKLKLKSLKAQFQYPLNCIVQIISLSVIGLINIPSLLILTNAFPIVGGWDFHKLAFIAGLSWMSEGVHHMLFFSFYNHHEMVWRGSLDRLLVRPLSLMLQIMTSGMNFSDFSGIISGIALLLISASKVEVQWSPLNIIYLVVIIISGAFIRWAVYLFFMTFDFFLKHANLLWVPQVFSGLPGRYPIHIFGTVVASILTFVFPFAFSTYYPAHYFFKIKGAMFWQGFVYMTPIVALITSFVSLIFWKWGLRHYRSTGT